MPKHYNRSYKPNKRRSGAHSKYSGYLDTASRALTVAYAVKKLINVEYRTVRTAFTADPNSTGAVVNLTAIAQGDDVDERQGNKIRAKHLKISGSVGLNASATRSQLRMMIVRDNNGSTTVPGIAALFSTVAVFVANRPKLSDPQRNSRFTVMWDKYILLDAINQEQAGFSFSMPLDHHIFYSGTASTDEGKGQLYLFIASNEATNDPAVGADAIVKFIDN